MCILLKDQKSLLFEIEYSEIDSAIQPRHRIMSAFEQKVEVPEKQYQYLLFAADPYETIAFKIPNMEIDFSEGMIFIFYWGKKENVSVIFLNILGKYYSSWDKDKKVYTLQIYFNERKEKPLPALPQKPSSFNPIGARF